MNREEILREVREVEKDLRAFKVAMDSVTNRLAELEGGEDRDRYETFARWPATQATINVLIMAVVRCEGILEEYHAALDRLGGSESTNVVFGRFK